MLVNGDRLLNLRDFEENPLSNAQMCLDMAPTHCDECGNFHLSNILRRATISPEKKILDGDEFQTSIVFAIEKIVRENPAPHIIVVGSTDTGLIAHLCFAAFKAGGESLVRKMKISLIDHCQTPLEICRVYAAKHRLNFEAKKSDFLSFTPTLKADLVLMHGVLRFLPLQNRDDYMAKISSWLADDGLLISSTHLGTKFGKNGDQISLEKAQNNLIELTSSGALKTSQDIEVLQNAISEGITLGESMPVTFDNADHAMAYYESVGLPVTSFWLTNTRQNPALGHERHYRLRGIALCKKLRPEVKRDFQKPSL